MGFSKRFVIEILLTLSFFSIFSGLLFAAENTESAAKEKYVFYTAIPSPTRDIIRGRLEEAFRRIGLTMELKIAVSAQRSLIQANDEGDGDANRVKNLKKIAPKNTANLLQIPEPILRDGFYVYSKNPEMTIDGWKSLKGYRNGARLGVKYVEKNLPEKRTFSGTTEQLLKMLANDRIDTVVDWGLITTKKVKDLKLTAVKQLSPPLAIIPTFAYIHKKHQSLVPQLAKALTEMKEDGTFETIKSEIIDPSAEQNEFIFYTGTGSRFKQMLEKRLNKIFNRIGKSVRLVSAESSQRALVLANEEGDGDAARNSNIKELSPESTGNLLQIPTPMTTSVFNVYSKKIDFSVEGWDSLREYRNGFRSGIKLFEKNVPGERIMLPSAERLFQMLDAERLDTVIEHSVVAEQIIEKMNFSGIKKLSPPLLEIPTYSYIHKKHKALIPEILKAIADLKKEGIL
ncbi:MAG: transporter substrate-binding domain-containing protein [SAR324 cluster bacterium]|nr:transporter substrate-binding domain-containing protein [SAR324 cluster bacterium]